MLALLRTFVGRRRFFTAVLTAVAVFLSSANMFGLSHEAWAEATGAHDHGHHHHVGHGGHDHHSSSDTGEHDGSVSSETASHAHVVSILPWICVLAPHPAADTHFVRRATDLLQTCLDRLERPPRTTDI